MSPRPNVLVLAVHPASVAATRLRAVQYRPHLDQQAIDSTLWTFFGERDLEAWYGRSQLRRALVALWSLRRLGSAVRLVRRAEVVIVQREAIPFGPPLLEWLAARRPVLIWDVDDAVWQPYVSPTAGRVPRWLRATADKFRRLCSMADEVWAGSEVLADWCRELNDRVRVVPTVVPVPDPPPRPTSDRTAAWIGSHSTCGFLEQVLPAVADVPRCEVLVVGARPRTPPGLSVRIREWSPQEEVSALQSTRVGLYPIDVGHPLAEGKCGLKAILYMSHGIPPVVTPTRTNAGIVRDGVEGLHATSAAEWRSAVARLLDDEDLWKRCSEAAWTRARDEYSLQVWGPRIAARLGEMTRGGEACAG